MDNTQRTKDLIFKNDLENLKGTLLLHYELLKIKENKENVINDLLTVVIDFLQKNYNITINTNNLNFEFTEN